MNIPEIQIVDSNDTSADMRARVKALVTAACSDEPERYKCLLGSWDKLTEQQRAALNDLCDVATHLWATTKDKGWLRLRQNLHRAAHKKQTKAMNSLQTK